MFDRRKSAEKGRNFIEPLFWPKPQLYNLGLFIRFFSVKQPFLKLKILVTSHLSMLTTKGVVVWRGLGKFLKKVIIGDPE